MSKREFAHGNANGEGSRHSKRRKEFAGSSSDVDITMSDPAIPHTGSGGIQADAQVVKEQGSKLWQTVKDAVNKEGRSISLDFLKRPSKRQYPDYYQVIQQPIALDDIKKQLDSGGYPSLEAVRRDFELCFTNAKKYNLKDSPIWKDAKDLLKLSNKTYYKLIPHSENGENADGGTGKKKSKSPNLSRLIKSKLQKLVDKTDDTGRILSEEFMELPSKKDWPTYYKQIKRPQCFENIFKRIKRKEYHTSVAFSNDVELVFTNALSFNLEHTGIWEDAVTLRDYFRHLVSDMPAPFSLPEYAKTTNGKLKIKMPAQAAHTFQAPQTFETPASDIPRVPGGSSSNDTITAPQPAPSPVPRKSPLPVASPAPVVQQEIVQAQFPAVSTPQPAVSSSLMFSHYPNASYVPSGGTAQAEALMSSLNSASNSPAPPANNVHQLKSVLLRTEPLGRIVNLDFREGVKCWAMRLGHRESGVHIKDIRFLVDEEEQSSGGEDDPDPEERPEEEEEEEDGAVAKGPPKKGKGRGRGRPKGTTKAAAAAKSKSAQITKKKTHKLGEVQLKLDGSAVQESEKGCEWTVNLTLGSHILEVGEVGGLVWKVYVERFDDP